MSPSSRTGELDGERETRVNWGEPQLFSVRIKRFQCFSTPEERDRFEYLKRSLPFAYIMASGDTCPQGTSNARHVATLAGLKTRREDHTTNGQEHKTAADQIPPAFT
jgi:hypothetical protein